MSSCVAPRRLLGAKRAVASSRYRALLRDLARWIEAGEWAATPTLDDSLRDAADFADRVIAKRARKVLRRATELRELNVEQRHRLRIAAKKLYYAIGFFETLFTDRGYRNRLTSFQLKLKSLLDELGALNDIAVQQQTDRNLVERNWQAQPIERCRTAAARPGQDQSIVEIRRPGRQ